MIQITIVSARLPSPQPIEISVEAGNILRLYRYARLGHDGDSNRFGDDPAGISCTYPHILDQVKIGHRVFIDDEKIEAVVRSSKEEYLELEILSPHGMIAKIKSNKGMNFPDSGIKTQREHKRISKIWTL